MKCLQWLRDGPAPWRNHQSVAYTKVLYHNGTAVSAAKHQVQAQDLPHQSRSADDWPHTRRTSGWLQHHHTMAHHSFSPSHKHQESYESYCLSHRTRYFQNWQPLTCFFRRQHRKLRSLPCLIVSKLFLRNDGKHSEVYVTQCTVSLMLYIGEGDSKGGEVDSKFTFSELDLSVCVCVCVCLCLGSVSVSVCLSLCSVFVLGSVSAVYLQYEYQCFFVFTICLYFLSLLQYVFSFFPSQSEHPWTTWTGSDGATPDRKNHVKPWNELRAHGGASPLRAMQTVQVPSKRKKNNTGKQNNRQNRQRKTKHGKKGRKI